MSNFVKAFCVCAFAFTIFFEAFMFYDDIIDFFYLGSDDGLYDTATSFIRTFLFFTNLILSVNGGLLILIGLPFYALISKFTHFGTLSCIIFGILMGAANQFLLIRLSHSNFYNDRLIYFLGVGAIFGIVLSFVYRFFNRPLTDMQKVNWQIYNKNKQ